MIVSTNNNPRKALFKALLNSTVNHLSSDAKVNEEKYLNRTASEFEHDVYDAIVDSAIGGAFEGTIELISGHALPDIIANDYYGVEVKTKHSNGWTTTGNSIFEGTRISSVERIYLLFGKLAKPVEFCCRPYEQCIYDVKVTHSPRYTIDMELSQEETIFRKINIPYDIFRNIDNTQKIRPIKEYYKRKHGPDVDFWWLDTETGDDELVTSEMAVRLWRNLDRELRDKIRNQIFGLFPRILGTSPKKYTKPAVWLVLRHSVVSISLRDKFTAGGQVTLSVNDKEFNNVPKIFEHLQKNVRNIKEELYQFPLYEMDRYWGTYVSRDEYLDLDRRVDTWIQMVSHYSRETLGDHNLETTELIKEKLQNG